MKILLTGGGSGGHITPLLAVAHELKKQSPKVSLRYVGERGSRFGHIAHGEELYDRQNNIFAGKFRRYHGETWIRRLLDARTNLANIRDMFYVVIGFIQSLSILLAHRPDIVFIKGGYVGLPVGITAWLLKIPYVTHDSDAVAGLTNKIIGKHAYANAVGMQGGLYGYNKDKIVVTGVPIREDFINTSPAKIKALRHELGIKPDNFVILITGGSNGARRLNEGLVNIVPSMLKNNKHLFILHQLGPGNLNQYGGFSHERLIKKDYIADLPHYSALADLIITRAGASAMAEYSVQRKACIVVPHPYLAAGHQLKNAQTLARTHAAEIINEDELISNPAQAKEMITRLLSDKSKREDLGKNLAKIMPREPTVKLASLLLGRPKG